MSIGRSARWLAVAVILSGPSLALAQTAAATQPPLIVGTWKLNPEKSGLRLPPDYINIRQYRLRPDGYLEGLLITGDPSRGYSYLQFTAKSDGQDYPEFTNQILGDMLVAGRQTPRAYSERAIDRYVTEWVDKANGKVTARGRKIVSSDGRTLTITVDGRPDSQATIYDRQP